MPTFMMSGRPWPPAASPVVILSQMAGLPTFSTFTVVPGLASSNPFAAASNALPGCSHVQMVMVPPTFVASSAFSLDDPQAAIDNANAKDVVAAIALPMVLRMLNPYINPHSNLEFAGFRSF